MALLVFLTFLSLIVNQYVPVWMKDSEAAHMDGAVGQFANLKSSIDFEALAALMSQNAGTIFVPSTTSTAITLGVDGVPIFSSPSAGALSLKPDQGNWSVWFQYQIKGVTTTVFQTASGQVDLSVANRYYPVGDIVYENGAVIRAQPDGQVVRGTPTFQAARQGTNLNLAFELVNLYGSGSAAGTSTQILNAQVFAFNQQSYNLTSSLYVNHTSAFGLGWFNFFNATLSSGLGITPSTVVSGPMTTVTGSYKGTTLYTILLNNLGTGEYQVKLAILKGPLNLLLTLQQNYVNVGIGQSSSTV